MSWILSLVLPLSTLESVIEEASATGVTRGQVNENSGSCHSQCPVSFVFAIPTTVLPFRESSQPMVKKQLGRAQRVQV